jgi:hypothetical protein
MGSIFGGGGGGSTQAPNPPKPLKINPQQMESEMVAADQAGYAQTDLYNSIYYPQLTQARDQMIGQAYQALTGPLNPSLENTFVNTGNMQSANALGTGDQGFGLSKGSLARNAAAATVASNEQGYQDYNRSVFENLNATFAPRAYGMTPEDAANIFTFNNTQMNNYLEQKFAGQTQAYYQNQGLAASQGASTLGAITSVIGSAAAAY